MPKSSGKNSSPEIVKYADAFFCDERGARGPLRHAGAAIDPALQPFNAWPPPMKNRPRQKLGGSDSFLTGT